MTTILYVKKLDTDAIIPTKGSARAAGYDLYALEDTVLSVMKTTKVRTGIAVSMPEHCYGRIAPRSSLGAKGIKVHGGVVDSDYRGEIIVLLQSTEKEYYIKKGERIAQLILERYEYSSIIEEVDSLDCTDRGEGGFGSTGK